MNYNLSIDLSSKKVSFSIWQEMDLIGGEVFKADDIISKHLLPKIEKCFIEKNITEFRIKKILIAKDEASLTTQRSCRAMILGVSKSFQSKIYDVSKQEKKENNPKLQNASDNESITIYSNFNKNNK